MMRPVRSVVLLLCAWVGSIALTGCTPPPPPPAKPMIVPATPEQATAAQASFAKLDPNSRVGHVAAVNEGTNLVAVTGIPIADVHHEDTVTFMDSKQAIIAVGTIKQANINSPEYPVLIVEYTVASGGRTPIKGDLAVYISTTPGH